MIPPRRAVRTDEAPRPAGPYSQAVVVEPWIFVAGQIPLDPLTNRIVDGEIEAQTEQVLSNLKAVLVAAGSSLDAVVRTTIYMADLRLFPRMNEIYARHFDKDPRPARSTIEASRLPLGAALEIDAVAVRTES